MNSCLARENCRSDPRRRQIRLAAKMTQSGPKCRINAGGWAVFLRAGICSAGERPRNMIFFYAVIFTALPKAEIFQLFCALNVGDGSSATVSSASEDLPRDAKCQD